MTAKKIANFRGKIGAAGHTTIKVLLSDGATAKEISEKLNVSIRSIRRHAKLSADWKPHAKKREPGAETQAQKAIALRRRRVDRIAKETTILRGEEERTRKGKVIRVENRTTKVSKYPSPAAIRRRYNHVHKTSLGLSTIRRDLIALGYTCYRAPRCPVMTPENEEKRLDFAKGLLPDLGKMTIVFSDEKWFNSNMNTRRFQWAKRRKDVRALHRSRWATKVHVWGCISEDGLKKLVFFDAPRAKRRGRKPAKKTIASSKQVMVNAEVYVKQCLAPNLRELKKGKRVLMQDGATPHRAKSTLDWAKRKGMKILKNWPAHSPDLNPIENLWGILSERVARRGPYGKAQLMRYIREEFKKINVVPLCESFRKRLVKVAKGKGLKRNVERAAA